MSRRRFCTKIALKRARSSADIVCLGSTILLTGSLATFAATASTGFFGAKPFALGAMGLEAGAFAAGILDAAALGATFAAIFGAGFALESAIDLGLLMASGLADDLVPVLLEATGFAGFNAILLPGFLLAGFGVAFLAEEVTEAGFLLAIGLAFAFAGLAGAVTFFLVGAFEVGLTLAFTATLDFVTLDLFVDFLAMPLLSANRFDVPPILGENAPKSRFSYFRC